MLDIGCGPLGSLEWAADAAERVGVDPLADRYLALNRGVHKMHYMNAGAEKLPFASEHFDVVSLFNALDHVVDPTDAIVEAERVLKPGGDLLVIVEINHKPTLTEPQTLREDVLDRFRNCTVAKSSTFAINSDHNVYESIFSGTPPRTANEPAIICARLVKHRRRRGRISTAVRVSRLQVQLRCPSRCRDESPATRSAVRPPDTAPPHKSKRRADRGVALRGGSFVFPARSLVEHPPGRALLEYPMTTHSAVALIPLASLFLTMPVLDAPATAADAVFDSFDELSDERWYLSDGWTNGAYQNCIWRGRLATVADGVLTLSYIREEGEAADGETRDYACAEVQTKRRFGPGLYETRMKAAPGSGLVSAFFTYIGPVHGEEHDEIDVEIPGRSPHRMQTNLYTAGKGGREDTHPIARDEFVTYSIDWQPDRIRWYIEGRLVREETENLPDTNAKVFYSIWGAGQSAEGWLGKLDESALPAVVEVDWFGWTPPGEQCLFPESISCNDDWPDVAG